MTEQVGPRNYYAEHYYMGPLNVTCPRCGSRAIVCIRRIDLHRDSRGRESATGPTWERCKNCGHEWRWEQ